MGYFLVRLVLIYTGLSIAIAFAGPAQAPPAAKVIVIKGQVTYQGKQLHRGDLLSSSGLVIVGKKSFLKLKIKKWGNTIILGPRSKMRLDLARPQSKKKYALLQGICRWITEKGQKEKKGTLYTQQAAMGVRGTDYLVKANSLLEETEIIVFDGKVQFSSLANKADRALIGKNEWGGLGGRFGDKIGKVLTLPSKVITHFKKVISPL